MQFSFDLYFTLHLYRSLLGGGGAVICFMLTLCALFYVQSNKRHFIHKIQGYS
jgi:hypothetical protein